MRERIVRGLWVAGTPARQALISLIWFYRRTLGILLGDRCRFYPSCSAYAEEAVRRSGAVRGVALTVWRLLRCSPLSRGGVDYPPRGRGGLQRLRLYDNAIHAGFAGVGSRSDEGAPT